MPKLFAQIESVSAGAEATNNQLYVSYFHFNICLPGTSSNANLIDFQAPGKLNVENLVIQTASATASADMRI